MSEQPKPKAVRKPRAPKATAEEKTAANAAAHDLIQAISWIDVAQRDDALRPIYEQHCVIAGGWIVAYDGVILAGHRISQEGAFAPNTAKLLAALVKSGDGLTMSHDSGKALLTVKSRKFRADVPCADMAALHIPAPESPMWEVGPALLEAFKIALPITRQAPEVIVSSLLITGNGTVMATDRRIFLEVYHGCALYECVVPRHFARIASAHGDVTHAGQSKDAITLWYGPNKFLRCQTYEKDTWPPNPLQLFEESKWAGVDVPKDLLIAVEAVTPHSPDGSVYLDHNGVRSAPSLPESAAFHECAGLAMDVGFAGKDLARAIQLANKIEYVDNRGLFFFGDNFRGKVAALAKHGAHMGSDQPAADHMAFDAPPGFVLPGVVDPPSWTPNAELSPALAYAAGTAIELMESRAGPAWTPNVLAGGFVIDDAPNPYDD